MQGRLSDCVDGKIQAFPWHDWRHEFKDAEDIKLPLMEWTLDQDHLYQNPLMTVSGRERIRILCNKHMVSIPSLTGDCFMQAPFWKADGQTRIDLQSDFMAIANACSSMGVKMIVVPLVDNGSLETIEQSNILIDFLLQKKDFFAQNNIKIVFESDFNPSKLASFIARLPMKEFGINYDIGNSAANGFDPTEEFDRYGSRVYNVHVKDRELNGSTVSLNSGNADFKTVFYQLSKQNYQGNFILQTARAEQGNHSEVLREYVNMTLKWMEESFVKI
jgi:L-ribulose-5-phosphate 3-epimerase